MRKLIIKSLLVLLPVFTLAIAFELIARTVPTTYSAKIDFFNKKKDKIEILVMGSSHANFGINPQYFGREAYNISNTSQGLYQDYKVLLKYLPECKNVKLVIIPISYFSLQSDLALTPEAWRFAYYYFYMGVEADAAFSMFDLKNHSALFLWDGPLEVIKGIRNINKMNINEYGYQTPEKSNLNINEIINDQTGKKRFACHEEGLNYNLLETNISTLNRMAIELHKKGIKIVFVTTPVYKTYYKYLSIRNYGIMTNTVDKIANKYTAKYVNYLFDKRFDIDDFQDNDHLNEVGAKKFSIILKNEVIDKLMEKE